MNLLIGILSGYLLGSIPFGLILTRLAKTPDLRSIGSGNIGATNVLRTGRKDLAALTLLLDGAKGAAAILIVTYLFGTQIGLVAGLGAVLGHIFPLWLRFNGGKGVATCFGILLAISWQAGLAGLATWVLVAWISRYSSLSALIAIAISPLYVYLLGERDPARLAIVLAVIVWITHYQNIRRLLQGKEAKIGGK